MEQLSWATSILSWAYFVWKAGFDMQTKKHFKLLADVRALAATYTSFEVEYRIHLLNFVVPFRPQEKGES